MIYQRDRLSVINAANELSDAVEKAGRVIGKAYDIDISTFEKKALKVLVDKTNAYTSVLDPIAEQPNTVTRYEEVEVTPVGGHTKHYARAATYQKAVGNNGKPASMSVNGVRRELGLIPIEDALVQSKEADTKRDEFLRGSYQPYTDMLHRAYKTGEVVKVSFNFGDETQSYKLGIEHPDQKSKTV